MATKSEYGQREIESAKSVIVEPMQILGEYREQMVLIGGWVQFFLFGAQHIGSTDVDSALDRNQITDDATGPLGNFSRSVGTNRESNHSSLRGR